MSNAYIFTPCEDEKYKRCGNYRLNDRCLECKWMHDNLTVANVLAKNIVDNFRPLGFRRVTDLWEEPYGE